MKKLILASVSVFALCALPLNARAITIDSFDDCAGVCQEAISTVVNTTVSSGTNASTLIGGVRKISAKKTGGNLRTSATVVAGEYSHSQDAGVTGQTIITWDSSTNGGLNSQGLGGVSLLQDGATAVVLKGLYADHSGKIKISFFDAADPNGTSSWSYTYTISNADLMKFFDLSIPFSSFLPDNPGVIVDFSNIGAIRLYIDGESDLDLSFELIGTNGICSSTSDIPNQAGKVIDLCGQCISQNPTLDNHACLDCAGVPNGQSQLDRCNVCNGDGNSCLGCSEKNIAEIQASLDTAAKKQEAQLKVVYARINASFGKNNPALAKKIATLKNTAHKLQLRNWVLSWTFPSVTRQCTNVDFCVTSSNQNIWDEYYTHAKALRTMMVDAIAMLKKLSKSKDKKFGSIYLSRMDTIYNNALGYLKQVPLTQTSCS